MIIMKNCLDKLDVTLDWWVFTQFYQVESVGGPGVIKILCRESLYSCAHPSDSCTIYLQVVPECLLYGCGQYSQECN